MEKTITIDGKDIRFVANLTFAYNYKNQFGTDILTKITPIISDVLKGMDDIIFNYLTDGDKQTKNKLEILPSQIGEVLENVYTLELIDILNVIWSMAKAGDPSIPEPEKWYGEFDEFPVYDVGKEVFEMFVNSFISKKKILKKPQPKKAKK
ncbi:MAG: hypothetical protein Q4P25_04220 [Tissierellia bacterium]|nr:hypothetical protein [Tissierellia bacterium]